MFRNTLSTGAKRDRGHTGYLPRHDSDEERAAEHWWTQVRFSGTNTSPTRPPEDQTGHRLLPIVSALLCPLAVTLDVPGLTERWYQRTVGFDVVETAPNPAILDAALAVSIALGILANLALIMRFLEKRTHLATWVAIVALSIHDVVNCATVTIFAILHRFNDGFTFGDAFWLTVGATVASLMCNITLVVDLVRTPNFAHSGSGLSEKQRSLVISVMVLLCYISLGALLFSFLLGYSFVNSLFFTVVTLSSLGLGDQTPNTTASRAFLFFFCTIGLILVAFTIALGRETIIERFETSYRRRREALAARTRERKAETKRHLQERRRRREREEEREKGREKGREDVDVSMSRTETLDQRRQSRRLDFDEEREHGLSRPRARINLLLRRLGWMSGYRPSVDAGSNGFAMNRTLTEQSISRDEHFKTFKKSLETEQRREFQLKLGVSLSLFLVFWVMGAVVFRASEGWTFFEGLYFSYTTFTTIGYGDFVPRSAAGRAFFIVWSLFGIAVMTLVLSVVTESWSSRFRSAIVSRKVDTVRSGLSPTASNQIAQLFTPALPTTLEQIPAALLGAARAFDAHARFFMHGRTGDAPEELRSLIDATDEFDEEFKKLHQEGDVNIDGQRRETKHFLFMVSYERALDTLSDTVEQCTEALKQHNEELATMKQLNEELRLALHRARREGSGVELIEDVEAELEEVIQEQEIEELEDRDRREAEGEGRNSKQPKNFFLRAHPGGVEDGDQDEELCCALDAEEDEGSVLDFEATTPPSPLSRALPATPSDIFAPLAVSAASTHRRASSTIADVSRAVADRSAAHTARINAMYDTPPGTPARFLTPRRPSDLPPVVTEGPLVDEPLPLAPLTAGFSAMDVAPSTSSSFSLGTRARRADSTLTMKSRTPTLTFVEPERKR